MKNSFLVGKKIYLRPLEISDLDGNYVSWLNDAEVCAHNSHCVFPYNRLQAEEYIKKSMHSTDLLVLAIVFKENDLHIGNISLQKIDLINRNAEYAILLGDKNYWGQGLSKDASTLILTHGFLHLNLHRIYCGTSAENIAMQNLALFLGMVHEGTRKEALYKRGTYVDILEYGVLSNDFLTRFAQRENNE